MTCYVHPGCLALQAIRQELITLKRNFGAPLPRIVVTGHSLGGALAILTGEILGRDLVDNACPGKLAEQVEVYTFAAPRVGDAGLCHLLATKDLQVVQVVNVNDPVPYVAPESKYTVNCYGDHTINQ